MSCGGGAASAGNICQTGHPHINRPGTWISTSFIQGQSQPSCATQVYDGGFPDYLTNNPAPTTVYVRVAPSQFDATKQVFWINGLQQPRLVLTVGKKYQFNVVACGHPFYFTTDSTGGHGNVGNVSPVVPSDYYVFTYTIDKNLPENFYYQCSLHPGMGGQVLIIN